MIVFSKNRQKTGGRGRLSVVRVTATNAEDFGRLVSACQELLPKGSWWGFWPTEKRPWPHNYRQTPHVNVRESMLPVLVAESAVELPEAYWQLCACWCKREFWETLVKHNQRELGDGAVQFWSAKERGCLVSLKKSGQWIKDVDWYEPDVSCELDVLIPGIKMIHRRIDNFDLGQRTPVNPGQSPANGPNGPVETDLEMDPGIPDGLEVYYTLPSDQRESWLAPKPWWRAEVSSRDENGRKIPI